MRGHTLRKQSVKRCSKRLPRCGSIRRLDQWGHVQSDLQFPSSTAYRCNTLQATWSRCSRPKGCTRSTLLTARKSYSSAGAIRMDFVGERWSALLDPGIALLLVIQLWFGLKFLALVEWRIFSVGTPTSRAASYWNPAHPWWGRILSIHNSRSNTERMDRKQWCPVPLQPASARTPQHASCGRIWT